MNNCSSQIFCPFLLNQLQKQATTTSTARALDAACCSSGGWFLERRQETRRLQVRRKGKGKETAEPRKCLCPWVWSPHRALGPHGGHAGQTSLPLDSCILGSKWGLTLGLCTSQGQGPVAHAQSWQSGVYITVGMNKEWMSEWVTGANPGFWVWTGWGDAGITTSAFRKTDRQVPSLTSTFLCPAPLLQPCPIFLHSTRHPLTYCILVVCCLSPH